MFNIYTEVISVIQDVGNHQNQLYQSIHAQITTQSQVKTLMIANLVKYLSCFIKHVSIFNSSCLGTMQWKLKHIMMDFTFISIFLHLYPDSPFMDGGIITTIIDNFGLAIIIRSNLTDLYLITIWSPRLDHHQRNGP